MVQSVRLSVIKILKHQLSFGVASVIKWSPPKILLNKKRVMNDVYLYIELKKVYDACLETKGYIEGKKNYELGMKLKECLDLLREDPSAWELGG